MSAIFGILRHDGLAVSIEALRRMHGAAPERGPDGVSYWREGPVGLGHALLETGCRESSVPAIATSGQATIAFEGRIDSGLSVDGSNHQDARALLLAAYARRGLSGFDSLVGDFSFGLWDDAQKMLFVGRDSMGVRPLFYSDTPKLFAFATDLRALLALDEVGSEIDETGIVHLFHPEFLFYDKESTAYRHVRRLPPAHHLQIRLGATARRHCYWALDPERELRLRSDEEYAEAFLEAFRDAVACRLPGDEAVGSALSGGLDSSSIVCVARMLLHESGRMPLHTFSAVFESVPEADESDYRAPLIAEGGFEAHLLPLDRQSPFTDLERAIGSIREPFFGPNYFIPWEICRAARACGLRVVFDGTDGDITVGHGLDRLIGLGEACRWKAFLAEATAITRRFDHPSYASMEGILRQHGLPCLERHARRGRWLCFVKGVNQIGRCLGSSRLQLVLHHGLGTLRPRPATLPAKFLASDFVRRVDLGERIREFEARRQSLRPGPRANHHRDLTSGALPYALEQLDRIAAAFSVEYRHPFCDRRLVELCLAMPPEQKLRNGWSRLVLRHAMTGILPKEVCWRGGKADMSPVYQYGLARFARDRLQAVVEGHGGQLWRYVDRKHLRQAHRRFLSNPVSADRQLLWRAVVLAEWLESR